MEIYVKANVAEIGTIIDELFSNVQTAKAFKRQAVKKENADEPENGFKTEFVADFGNVSEFLSNIMGGNKDD